MEKKAIPPKLTSWRNLTDELQAQIEARSDLNPAAADIKDPFLLSMRRGRLTSEVAGALVATLKEHFPAASPVLDWQCLRASSPSELLLLRLVCLFVSVVKQQSQIYNLLLKCPDSDQLQLRGLFQFLLDENEALSRSRLLNYLAKVEDGESATTASASSRHTMGGAAACPTTPTSSSPRSSPDVRKSMTAT